MNGKNERRIIKSMRQWDSWSWNKYLNIEDKDQHSTIQEQVVKNTNTKKPDYSCSLHINF